MIGILNAYEFDPEITNYQLVYTQLFKDYVKKTFPKKQICDYKIAKNEWPKNVSDCELWFITGSAKSVYDTDPWIKQLQDFVVEVDQQKKKMIAVCFGHQLVAQALGGAAEKSPAGWGVGVKSFNVVSKETWMNPAQDKISLLFSHQDQVTKAPPTARVLASDNFCPIQIMQIGKHILSLQGHPEFSVEFATDRLTTRRAKIPQDIYNIAMNSFAMDRDDDLISDWILQFFNEKFET